MNTFKLAWDIHKWVGLVLAIIVAMISVTGFLLLVKKDFASLQPPTQRGADGTVTEFLPIADVLAAAAAHAESVGQAGFATVDDIDRIDVRLDKRVHKIRSNTGHLEIQVDAVTGAILSGPSVRRSDLIERIHDGSFFGDWAHGWVMPATAIAMLVLVVTGIWVWVTPIVRRRRRRRARTAAATAAS